MGHILLQGSWGVQLFFAISGFILGLPFAKYFLGQGKPVKLKNYFIRRLTRLEPPYIIAMGVMVLFLLAESPSLTIVKHWLISMGYSHVAYYHTMSTINMVTWSLEVEVQFYLLAPLLAFVYSFQRAFHRMIAFMSIIIGITAISALASKSVPWLGMTIVAQLPFFLVGMLGADLFVRRPNAIALKTRVWDLVALGSAISAVFVVVHEQTKPIAHFILPIFILPILLSAWLGEMSRKVLSFQPFALIGGMCYTIYLWHVFFFGHLVHLAKSFEVPGGFAPNFLVQCIVWTLITLPAFTVLYLLFERPFMDPIWPQKFSSRVRRRLANKEDLCIEK